MSERIRYDEFGLFHENIAEYDLGVSPNPRVERSAHVLADGRKLSFLRWGSGEPRIVLVHGGSQNAHTWDTVALGLGESLIAAFLDAGHSQANVDRWFIRTSARPHLDLWTANRDQLVAAGMPPANIHLCGLSTVSHPDIFDSYRVAGEGAGRMAGLVVVPPPR